MKDIYFANILYGSSIEKVDIPLVEEDYILGIGNF